MNNYGNRMHNLGERNKFLAKYKLPKLLQGETHIHRSENSLLLRWWYI